MVPLYFVLMKKSYSKYLFEFLIIVFGISVSFQFDKYSEEVEKEKLKNQSLNRILKNIQQDIADHTLNINIHQDGVTSIEWVLDNYENTGIDRAEIGRELTSAILMNTILVDNQEEYRSLQNSGLIEKIENDSLVNNLQQKYSAHTFYKKIEQALTDLINNNLTAFHYNNSISEDSLKRTSAFLNNGRIYTGKLPIDRTIIEVLKDKKFYHEFYIRQIKNRIKRDGILIQQIQAETNNINQ